MFLKCYKLKIYWCYLYIFVIQAVICYKRRSMQGIKSQSPHADPGFFIFFGGGGGGCRGGGAA